MARGEAMSGGQGMIAAGIGLRPGTGETDIRACLDLALARLDLTADAIGCIATTATRAAEPGLASLAVGLGVPVVGIPDEALRGEDAGCATRSSRVVALYGVGSVAEAAALAAAGPQASLILPRLSLGRVTCALARGAKP
jgi:cobalt-precorrin 5A hydrolase